MAASRDQTGRVHARSIRSHRFAQRLALGGLALTLLAPFVFASVSHAADEVVGTCLASAAQAEGTPKKINLVLDDSGSMFLEEGTNRPLPNWSFAKYALEVFAALMGPEDELNVYRLSDYVPKGGTQRPELQLVGEARGETVEQRVQQIHDMPLQGRGTPYAAVQKAFEDLQASPGEENWLVILTDGAFEEGSSKISETELRARIDGYSAAGQESGDDLRIALLALGQGVPGIESNPEDRIFGAKAANGQQLLEEMALFANIIFGRDGFPLDRSGLWEPGADAIEMSQLIVLAQGDGSQVDSAIVTDGAEVLPAAEAKVSWVENPDVERGGKTYQAIPDESLTGEVAFFTDVPAGDVKFNIGAGAGSVLPYVFYKPQADLGVRLSYPDGSVVPDGIVEAGEYKVEYGFLDDECNIVNSRFLGDVSFSDPLISINGEVVAKDFASGDVIDIPKGDVDFSVNASYLQGTQVSHSETRSFAAEALPSDLVVEPVSFPVSELDEPKLIPLEYSIVEDGVVRAPTDEEWALLDPDSFDITSESNLEFSVVKTDEPGRLDLKVEAPDGDIYAAQTGEIEATVTGSYVSGRADMAAQTTVPMEVVDDLSAWDRFINWFKTIGWKLLLALLALLLLLGYLLKKRFSNKVKNKPTIAAIPKTVGNLEDVTYNAKFERNGLRRFLPFVADTATLKYVPSGESGFRPLKLKAGPGKTMIVTNWRDIAKANNVSINGNPINEDTKRPPIFGPNSSITADTPQMTYEVTPTI